jgi:hypothetical protein
MEEEENGGGESDDNEEDLSRNLMQRQNTSITTRSGRRLLLPSREGEMDWGEDEEGESEAEEVCVCVCVCVCARARAYLSRRVNLGSACDVQRVFLGERTWGQRETAHHGE